MSSIKQSAGTQALLAILIKGSPASGNRAAHSSASRQHAHAVRLTVADIDPPILCGKHAVRAR